MGFMNFTFLYLLAVVALVVVLQITATTLPWYPFPSYPWTAVEGDYLWGG
jgi:hypothetical protein